MEKSVGENNYKFRRWVIPDRLRKKLGIGKNDKVNIEIINDNKQDNVEQLVEWLNRDLGINNNVDSIANMFEEKVEKIMSKIYNSNEIKEYDAQVIQIQKQIKEKCDNSMEIIKLVEKYEEIISNKWDKIQLKLYKRGILDILVIWQEANKMYRNDNIDRDIGIDIHSRLEQYMKDRIFNLKDYFASEDIEILKKIGITIENRKYTQNEIDLLEMSIYDYCEEGEAKIEELEALGVKKQEYEKLLDTFNELQKEIENISEKIYENNL